MATGKQVNFISKFVRSTVVLSVRVVWSFGSHCLVVLRRALQSVEGTTQDKTVTTYNSTQPTKIGLLYYEQIC